MAASVTSQPATPASCYRPMRFNVVRTVPPGTLIVEVFIADSSDVSSLGNGLQAGDVVVYFTGTVFGAVSVQAGQTIIMDADCGPYAGVQMVTNYFVDGSDKYMVIDAVNAGDFTPASMTGSFKVWLNNYTIHCRVLVYTDPNGAPQVVDLSKLPSGVTNSASFDVALVIKDYFSHMIDTIMADGILFDAHGIASLFYRVHIAEAYDQPSGVLMDPFDGTHTILEDDVELASTFRVAVNGIHPYTGTNLDWSDSDFSDFVIGVPTSRFLTNAPRRITLNRGDSFRLVMLTAQADDYALTAKRVVSVTGVGSEGADIEIGLTSSFAIACGPADIAGLFETEPTRYIVRIRDIIDPAVQSETITIDVVDKCTEVRRPFGWLNKLGGVDMYTFTGREITSSKVKRATVRKPYGIGTGFDWTERQYRSEPDRTAMVSTLPLPKEVREWLVQDFFESPNINAVIDSRPCTCVLLTDEVVSNSSGPYYKPLTVEYRVGVNGLSQQA